MPRKPIDFNPNEKPSENQIDRATKYYEILVGKRFLNDILLKKNEDVEKPKESISLDKQIKAYELYENKDREDWRKKKFGSKNKGGISYVSLNSTKNCIKWVVLGKSLDDINNEKTNNFESIDSLLDKAEDTIKYCLDFIKYVKKKRSNSFPHKKSVQYLNKNISDNTLSGTRWAVYFHHLRKEDYNKDFPEPVLGRSIIEIKDLSERKYPILFYNIDGISAENYSGTYKSHMNMPNKGLVIFDINADEEIEKGRNIHIKVYCRSKHQEILLGQYVSYENGKVQSGRVVFQNISSSTKRIEPKVFSFIHNYEEFISDEKVSSSIIEHLSIKSENFNDGIEDDIRDLNALRKYLDDKRPFDKKRYERFLERQKPKIFLASADSDNIITPHIVDIKKHLNKVFKNKIYVSYKKGVMYQKIEEIRDSQYEIDQFGYRQPNRDFERLRSTRFFILFVGEIKNISYSYLQLGMAISVCKEVIVITKKGDERLKTGLLSETIDKMRSSVIHKIYYDYDFEQEKSKVLLEIVSYVKSKLPSDNFDGDWKVI